MDEYAAKSMFPQGLIWLSESSLSPIWFSNLLFIRGFLSFVLAPLSVPNSLAIWDHLSPPSHLSIGNSVAFAKFASPGKISMELLEFALLAIEVKVRPLSFPPSSGPFDLFASRPPRPFFWTRGNTWEFTLKEPNWPAPVDLTLGKMTQSLLRSQTLCFASAPSAPRAP